MVSRRRRTSGYALFGCLLLAACSSSDLDAAAESDSARTTPTATDADVADEAATTTNATTTTTTDTATDTVEPLRPDGEPAPERDDDGVPSAWISRVSMSSTSIEVTWSASDGASELVIHRIERVSDTEPALDELSDDTIIHVADEAGRFVDEGVEANTPYWYALEALSDDGDLVALGWHRAASVDDETPPAPVDIVTAIVENDEVLITWSEPAENYELHAYLVLRSVDGEELETIATTWRLDQRSFIDDHAPATGEVSYAVIAVDFHWNASDPAEVTVDLN